MKKIFVIFLFVIICINGYSQNYKIYKGNSTFSTNLVYTIKDNKIYRGSSTFFPDLVYTIEDGKVYKGDSMFSSDLVYTIE